MADKKPKVFKKDGLILSITNDLQLRADNSSKERYIVEFIDPSDGKSGYSNKRFSPGVWCMSNPLTWSTVKDTGIVDVVFTAKEKRHRIKVDLKKGIFTDNTNPKLKVANFIPEKTHITVIIPAFGAKDYIEKCIDGFLHQVDKSGEIELEILVGIDSCWETLKEVSKKIYPKNVKFYYFKENVGPYYIRNSLIGKASHEILLFFDSDDIPGTTLLRVIAAEITQVDVVHWKFFWFEKEDQIYNGNNLEVGFLTHGVFAIKKKDILKRKGFYHWRVGADSEFHERARSKGMTYKSVHQPLFFRRRLSTSLTQNPLTGHKTDIRRAYNEIVDENSRRDFFPDPQELRTAPCMRV